MFNLFGLGGLRQSPDSDRRTLQIGQSRLQQPLASQTIEATSIRKDFRRMKENESYFVKKINPVLLDQIEKILNSHTMPSDLKDKLYSFDRKVLVEPRNFKFFYLFADNMARFTRSLAKTEEHQTQTELSEEQLELFIAESCPLLLNTFTLKKEIHLETQKQVFNEIENLLLEQIKKEKFPDCISIGKCLSSMQQPDAESAVHGLKVNAYHDVTTKIRGFIAPSADCINSNENGEPVLCGDAIAVRSYDGGTRIAAVVDSDGHSLNSYKAALHGVKAFLDAIERGLQGNGAKSYNEFIRVISTAFVNFHEQCLQFGKETTMSFILALPGHHVLSINVGDACQFCYSEEKGIENLFPESQDEITAGYRNSGGAFGMSSVSEVIKGTKVKVSQQKPGDCFILGSDGILDNCKPNTHFAVPEGENIPIKTFQAKGNLVWTWAKHLKGHEEWIINYIKDAVENQKEGIVGAKLFYQIRQDIIELQNAMRTKNYQQAQSLKGKDDDITLLELII